MHTPNTGRMAIVATAMLAVAGMGCASRTKTGAVVGATGGAVLGAGAGAVAGGNKGALIGAGVGAAAGATAGALIGRYMDKQEAALKKEVKSAQVQRKGDKLVVNFNSQILFDLEKADVKPEAKEDLIEFANVLKKYQDTDLVIEGHADSTGDRDFNEALSWRRARAVIDFLEEHGVARGRMSAQGYGEERPVASNTTEDGRRQNRRVQIQIAANDDLERRAAAEARERANQPKKTAAR